MFPIVRMRRYRRNNLRKLFEETTISVNNLVMPLFIKQNLQHSLPISSMPGQFEWGEESVLEFIEDALRFNLKTFLLFGIPLEKFKDDNGSYAIRHDSVIPNTIRKIKSKFPEAIVVTDVCFCAYTSHGHCGLLDKSSKNEVDNDKTLNLLAEMALAHAQAGADIVAPSDMMDGRVGYIRKYLDKNGYSNTLIMSYSAKFASSLYGPFRDVAQSAPIFGDRKSYQINFANFREAIRELEFDYSEGADILMIKPALPYLDVIKEARKKFLCPIAAYQVSGEYAMIKTAAEKGYIDERKVVIETLTAIKRAGADLIITYFAKDVSKWLCEDLIE